MKMNKLMKRVSLLAFLFLMASCSTVKSTQTNQKENIYRAWKLIEVNGQLVPVGSKAGFIVEADNKASGSTGCNRFTGNLKFASSNILEFSPIATTRMACPEDISNFETLFLEAMAAAKSWRIEADTLFLLNGSEVVAKLSTEKQPTAEQAKLNGTWELNYISGPRIAFEGLYPDKKPAIIFNLPDSVATGNSSCNRFSIPFTLQTNKITFGEGLSTMMACEGEGETVFLQTLKKINSYSLSKDGQTLNLIMGDIAVMRFTKK